MSDANKRLIFAGISATLLVSIMYIGGKPNKEESRVINGDFPYSTQLETTTEEQTSFIQLLETRTEQTTITTTTVESTTETEPVTTEGVSENDILTTEEVELIALVTMAEAEGESELGKRLVIDTILNRVDSEHFPDSVTDVIYQKNQFTSVWNGRSDRCYVREDICQLVREEALSRTNTEVVFFTAYAYGKYGTPLFQIGNHCFAKY